MGMPFHVCYYLKTRKSNCSNTFAIDELITNRYIISLAIDVTPMTCAAIYVTTMIYMIYLCSQIMMIFKENVSLLSTWWNDVCCIRQTILRETSLVPYHLSCVVMSHQRLLPIKERWWQMGSVSRYPEHQLIKFKTTWQITGNNTNYL